MGIPKQLMRLLSSLEKPLPSSLPCVVRGGQECGVVVRAALVGFAAAEELSAFACHGGDGPRLRVKWSICS